MVRISSIVQPKNKKTKKKDRNEKRLQCVHTVLTKYKADVL